ncbi:MAG: ribbon-helix-helix domain-containing protein [Actinomycetota bacterium]
MKRTTIMVDEKLLERARAVARREGVPLAEVIRQGLELRVRHKPKRLSLVGIGASGHRDTARRSGDMSFEPRSWR